MTCGLEKLILVDQNCMELGLSALLLKTLAVGRRQQSESIEVALDGIMMFDVVRCLACKVSHNLSLCNPPVAGNTF